MRRQLKFTKIYTRFLWALLLICFPTQASFEDLGVGARQQGMGEAFVGFATTSDALFWNPAGLAAIRALEISTYYSRPFGLKELAHNTFSASLPVGTFHTGLGIRSFGYSAYSENTYTLGVAGKYQDKFYYGVTLNYLSLAIKNYGSAATAGVNLGLLVNFNPRLAFGFVAKNINRPTLGSQHEYLPQVFVAGFLLQPYPNLTVTGDVYKDVRFASDPRAGIEYRLLSKIFLRAGAAWEPARYSLGLGLEFSHFRIDYAFQSHPTLNLTHLFSVSFSRNPPVPPVPEEFSAEPEKLAKPGALKPGETININTAGVEELMRLPGVGRQTALAIINYRESEGAFVTLTELTEIRGIGTSKFKKLLPFIRLKD